MLAKAEMPECLEKVSQASAIKVNPIPLVTYQSGIAQCPTML
jgi:hypothetical protein